MSSLFLTVLQATLACTQLAGAAAEHGRGAVVVDLTLVDQSGAPFAGPLSLRLRQRAPGASEEWTSHAVEFDAAGRIEQTIVGLGAVDPAWAVWARVERNARWLHAGPETRAFYGERSAPCRGTASLRLPPASEVASSGGGPPRLRATIVLEATPVYGRVRVVGASAEAPYRLCMWDESWRRGGTAREPRWHDTVDAVSDAQPTVVRSRSEAEAARYHVLDADGRLVHSGSLARGAVDVVDPSRVGHVLVDPGRGAHRVFVVPRAEHAPPTARERANSLAKHIRLGRIKVHECRFDADAGAFVAECLAPGVHVVEVWREGGSDVPPFAPSHIAEVLVQGGETARYDVP